MSPPLLSYTGIYSMCCAVGGTKACPSPVWDLNKACHSKKNNKVTQFKWKKVSSENKRSQKKAENVSRHEQLPSDWCSFWQRGNFIYKTQLQDDEQKFKNRNNKYVKLKQLYPQTSDYRRVDWLEDELRFLILYESDFISWCDWSLFQID